MGKTAMTPRGIKTSVELPAHLLRAAKIRAIDEPGGIRAVIARALSAYLKVPVEEASKGSRKGG
jgi:hypothetical protein